MTEEKVSQEFRLKNIDETRNYFIEEINQNEIMNKKHKKVCRVLNYIENLFILMCFNFCIYFFSWYSCRKYEFCNRTENLCNKCKN